MASGPEVARAIEEFHYQQRCKLIKDVRCLVSVIEEFGNIIEEASADLIVSGATISTFKRRLDIWTDRYQQMIRYATGQLICTCLHEDSTLLSSCIGCAVPHVY